MHASSEFFVPYERWQPVTAEIVRGKSNADITDILYVSFSETSGGRSIHIIDMAVVKIVFAADLLTTRLQEGLTSVSFA